ncbi:HAMP domain-containing sensor histidine kinase [Streptomyces sp. KMM 9044]|nr:HAMP domain-containing sensor histidine kinase [Streptomyces sp. KMM 9044]WAX81797.1 HAMP domain-containing sensor histidine kinase [Streptomyces sp. KMM 9044]
MLASSLLIVVCAIAATAWLAVRTTTNAVRDQQGQVLADDTMIYRTLMSYAATHPDWSDAEPVVRDLARRTGRHVTVTPQDTAQSVTGGPVRASRSHGKPFATIDPLHTDPFLSPQAKGGSIDPTALGPYALRASDRQRLGHAADAVATCLTDASVPFERSTSPAGRPIIALLHDVSLKEQMTGADQQQHRAKRADECGLLELDVPTAGEDRALTTLNQVVNACLRRQRLPTVRLGLDFTSGTTAQDTGTHSAQNCIDTGRREQLAPYVAPAALLYVGNTSGSTSAPFDLSPANVLRTLVVTAAVLLLAAFVTVVTGIHLVRPLRALTRAAQDRDAHLPPVPVVRHDEIGRLTAAFNELSEHRARTEQQRRVMVSDIAHELRTPLSTIRSALEATQDGIIEADQHLTASLLEEVLLLQHVIDDLQDLAAADAGTLRLYPEPVLAEAVLRHVTDAHRTAAEKAEVTLLVHNPARLDLWADPLRLRQIVGNLVSNAVRHTPPGGRVTLHTHRDDATAVIEVTDTGTGITEEDLPFVFERFWRAEKSRNRKTGGSGLGLSIARKLTEAHGGVLSAAGAPGRGATFTIRLPLSEENEGTET